MGVTQGNHISKSLETLTLKQWVLQQKKKMNKKRKVCVFMCIIVFTFVLVDSLSDITLYANICLAKTALTNDFDLSCSDAVVVEFDTCQNHFEVTYLKNK